MANLFFTAPSEKVSTPDLVLYVQRWGLMFAVYAGLFLWLYVYLLSITDRMPIFTLVGNLIVFCGIVLMGLTVFRSRIAAYVGLVFHMMAFLVSATCFAESMNAMVKGDHDARGIAAVACMFLVSVSIAVMLDRSANVAKACTILARRAKEGAGRVG